MLPSANKEGESMDEIFPLHLRKRFKDTALLEVMAALREEYSRELEEDGENA
jgi:hypothetical protein